MTSQRQSRGTGKPAGGFGFSIAGDKRKRLAEYPCVSRLRQRRLLVFLWSHKFSQTLRAYVHPENPRLIVRLILISNACKQWICHVYDLPDNSYVHACRFTGETDAFMDVMHLHKLALHGQWSEAIKYLSRFLPSDRPLGVHGRALHHFLRLHKAIDDIVAGEKEALSVKAAVSVCSDRFPTLRPALARLRIIFSFLIESKTLRYHSSQ